MKTPAFWAAWMQLSRAVPISTGARVTDSLLMVASMAPAGVGCPLVGLMATKTVGIAVVPYFLSPAPLPRGGSGSPVLDDEARHPLEVANVASYQGSDLF